ncbi:adenylyltransferase and sulfurtransferase MOCS3 isoform X2 [Formica exsecta]|uniref:adenylyltransferase and sulfurtransferase MOCS3 isoform X1 n=1 Tax=Formica exsecta TaxID=72781 RepID=UPI00114187AE|nr:adenylyltransferase and sulfurtransferase MOCS3 isoform X1 [Formica exsecta]XP_029677142.1 adenylyltransferase and sulfurtransferase MOCS3 isoform X2 [Formica exsecta]
MDKMSDTSEDELVAEIADLRALLHAKEVKLARLRREKQVTQEYGLDNDEIRRYSRQLFLTEIGVQGQKKIKDSSVLIVGAGGLGCPAALYLACAGVGHIGIVDYDNVEINNLHRQLLYTETDVGTAKVVAATESINRLNSYVKVTPYCIQLTSKNALNVVENYDIVIDGTDNVATRYLLNDACVLSGKPLVSGSALRFEGHLSVFNYNNGPCYRCVFPEPPSPETVTNCGDGGVLGAAVGAIGVLQALETLKIILNMPDMISGRLLLFDGTETKFRNVRLRPKNTDCVICGQHPVIHELIDYEEFCGAKANDKDPNLNLLRKEERISAEEYNDIAKVDSKSHILIDVRSPEEYEICSLQDSINIPFTQLSKDHNLNLIRNNVEKAQEEHCPVDMYILCRRGNDSQKAVQYLKKLFTDDTLRIRDIIGGIHAWSNKIDPKLPKY